MSDARGLAFCTAVTASFVSFARVLAQSLGRFHPEARLVAALAERDASGAAEHEPDLDVVPIGDLGLPDLWRQAFINPPHELTVLAKPLVMRHLLDRGFETVVFLDSDVLVLDTLGPLVATAASHAVTLTPHLLEPPETGDAVARELGVLRSGAFNGGCVAVSNRPEARRFLDWWIARLRTHNRLEPHAGFHHDQRWLDLAPALFDEVAVVRDPGCNVAYWNILERRPGMDGSRVVVGGAPCRFFHFSGFDPARPDVLSRHARGVSRTCLGEAAVLLDRYASALADAGIEASRRQPYSFGAFDNGTPVPTLARMLYRDLGEAAAARFGNPFRTDEPESFHQWLRSVDSGEGPGRGLPRLWQAVYRSRPDLRQAISDPGGADRERFRRWARESGIGEHAIDASLLP